MIKALFSLVRVLRVLFPVWLVELAGAALVVAGIYLAWGLAAALVAGGVALLLKAFELDMRTSP